MQRFGVFFVLTCIPWLVLTEGRPLRAIEQPTAQTPPVTDQEGRYYGLGITINVIDGDITVMSISEGSPASRMGLRRGDVIAEISGEDASDMTIDEAVSLLRGPRGSSVEIAIRRAGYDELIDLSVERDEITQDIAGLVEQLALLASDSEEFAQISMQLADAYWETGDFADADFYFNQALGFYDRNPTAYREDVVRITTRLGIIQGRQGNHAAAISYFGRALELSQTDPNASGRDIADRSSNLAYAHVEAGDPTAAILHYEQALRFYDTDPSAYRAAIRVTTADLGHANYTAGNYAAAIRYYEQVLRFYDTDPRARASGRGKEDRAEYATRLGLSHYAGGGSIDAIRYFEQALRFYETDPTTYRAALGRTAARLAVASMEVGNLTAALSYYERALSDYELAPDVSREDTAGIADALGLVNGEAGNLTAALSYYERALSYYELTPDVYREEIERNGFMAASAYVRNGDTGTAIDVLLRHEERSQALLGPDKGRTGRAMVNLASWNTVPGQALMWAETARTLVEDAFGTDAPELASVHSLLGSLHGNLGEHDEALPEFLQAFRLQNDDEGSLGALIKIASALGRNERQARGYTSTNLLVIAQHLMQRAELLKATRPEATPPGVDWLGGREVLGTSPNSSFARMTASYLEAKAFLADTLETQARTALNDPAEVLGHWEDILRVSTEVNFPWIQGNDGLLHELAGSQVKVGDLDAAKTTLERLRANGSQTHSTRTLLGVVRYLLGDIPGAVREWIAAAELELRLLERSIGVGVLTEQQVLQFQPTELEGNTPISYLLSASLADEVLDVDTIWEFVARTRPVRFDEILSRHRVVSERNPELTRLADNFASARARVAQGLVQAVSVPTEQNREAFRTLRDEREEAEVALTQANHAYQETRTNATGQEFRAARSRLATREALVAFFAYGRYDWVPEQYDSPVPSYVAFIQTGQQPPVIVPIGTEEDVQRSVEAWHQEVARPAETGEFPTVDDEHRYREVGATLRELVWDPLVPHLSNVDQVFVVPDGALHTVTLSSLPSGADAYLLEEGPTIHYLSNEVDLARQPRDLPVNTGLLALGNPTFNEPLSALPGTVSARSDDAQTVFAGRSATCDDFRTGQWGPLTASSTEVSMVVDFWEGQESATPPTVTRLTGTGASESAFKQRAPGHRILHLATHAFLLDENCTPPGLEADAVRADLPQDEIASRILERAEAILDHDDRLVLSGFAVAGANNRAEALSGQDDGILTAEEIATLDLSGVEWAVLSGCETALGSDSATGDSLRRAFQAAGVQTLIMSLWRIQDEAAQKWMAALYQGRFRDGRSTVDAVHHASLDMLRERRASAESTHPFFWAPFIATGNWQ